MLLLLLLLLLLLACTRLVVHAQCAGSSCVQAGYTSRQCAAAATSMTEHTWHSWAGHNQTFKALKPANTLLCLHARPQVKLMSDTSILITPGGGLASVLNFLRPSATAITMTAYHSFANSTVPVDGLFYE